MKKIILSFLFLPIDTLADTILYEIEKCSLYDSAIKCKNSAIYNKKAMIEKYHKLCRDLQEDVQNKLVTEDEYQNLYALYKGRMERIQKQMDVIKERTEDGWTRSFIKFGVMDELTREAAATMIDEILVFEKRTSDHYPRIEIRYRFASLRTGDSYG